VSEAKRALVTLARSLATTPDDDGKQALLSLVDKLKTLVPTTEAKPAGGLVNVVDAQCEWLLWIWRGFGPPPAGVSKDRGFY
jgi:hypothetical protein